MIRSPKELTIIAERAEVGLGPDAIVPRPYQTDGIADLKRRKRFMLYWEPGIGKTIPALTAAYDILNSTPITNHNSNHCLIIGPTYLCQQWADVIAKQYPHVSIVNAASNKTKLDKQEALFSLETNPTTQELELTFPDFTIINKEMLRTVTIPMSAYKVVIIDESHHFRHVDTQIYGEAIKLAQTCEYLFLLTGSPIMKEPDDLHGQLKLLFPSQEIWQQIKERDLIPPLPEFTTYGLEPVIQGETKAKTFTNEKLTLFTGGPTPSLAATSDNPSRTTARPHRAISFTDVEQVTGNTYPLPKYLKSYNAFVDRYCIVRNTQFGRKISGGHTKRIRDELIDRFTSHYSYRDVHLYLPKLIEQVIELDMSPADRKRYNEIRLYYRDLQAIDKLTGQQGTKVFTNVMAVMQALRQVTMTADKITAVANLVQDTLPHPTVVFCWYKEHASRLAEALTLAMQNNNGDSLPPDVMIPCLTGDIPPAERTRLATYSINNNVPIVATLASLSEGVDLSHAHACVFAEEFYTPGMHKQAVDRIRRWSEDVAQETHRPVLLYFTHMKDTIDQEIHKVTQGRKLTIEDIVKNVLED